MVIHVNYHKMFAETSYVLLMGGINDSYHNYLFRQMLTYGRRIPLPELDKRLDVSICIYVSVTH